MRATGPVRTGLAGRPNEASREAWRRRCTRAAVAGCAILLVADVVPREAAQPGSDPSVEALERALDRRMTVWRAGTRSVYVSHCRAARGGCPERTAAFARMIGDVSREHMLDPFLLAAVAVRESGMDPSAAGAVGERGIVQLHPRGSGSSVRYVRSEAYRRRCARRPGACQREVLDAGARLLSHSIARCGGIREGLGAYNRGACGATGYARRVMSERQRLLRLAKADAHLD